MEITPSPGEQLYYITQNSLPEATTGGIGKACEVVTLRIIDKLSNSYALSFRRC